MRPELAALVVHDLKNALGALEAELGLLAAPSSDEARKPEARGIDTQRAARSHQQCGELRQRFVQFLALYAADQQMQAHCTDESPIDVMNALLRGHHDTATGPVLSISEDAATPPFWYFDRRLVQMALEAALHNARRFARERVVLSAHSVEGYLVFGIDDDGPGLGATDTSDEAAHTTGLGTALCQAVAQAHSSASRTGKVVLCNRTGGGARFELWLA